MGVKALRFPTPAARASRRWLLFAAVAIVVVLFGMLAMHAMTATASGVPVASHTQVDLDHSSPIPATSVSTGSDASTSPVLASSCVGACELDCLLFGLLCALGTMAAVITLMLHQRNSPRLLFATLTHASDVVVRHVALLKPPSLLVLSVSRT